MDKTNVKKTCLAVALTALIAPACALAQAQDPSTSNAANGNANRSQPQAASTFRDTVRDPYGMQTTNEGRDAYREGLIWATYAANPALDAYRLGVDVQGNRAILTGRVESDVDKRLAERIAKRAQGVTEVDNRIQVDPLLVVTMIGVRPVDLQDPMRGDVKGINQMDNAGSVSSRSDNVSNNGMRNDMRTDGKRMGEGMDYDHRSDFSRGVGDDTLAAMVNSRLLWNAETDGTDIDVSAHDGVVVLTGRADTMAAKNTATRLAQSTRGVVRVDNRLTVDSTGQVAQAEAGDGDQSMSDTWVAAKVNSSLMWSAGVNAGNIDVEARDGLVTLTGTADSAAAKQQAIDLAQSVRGVQRVDASGLKVATGSVSSN